MNKQAKTIIFSLLYLIGILSFIYPVFIFAGIIAIIYLIYLYKKEKFSFNYLIAIILIYVSGIINTSFHLKLYDDLTPYTDKSNVTAVAKVLSIPTNNQQNRTKFYAKVEAINFDDYSIDNLKAKTYITINDNSEKLNTIKIGDKLELKGRLKAPENSKNPSQFDYARYLQLKNTFSLMYVTEDWKKINSATDTKGKVIRKLNDTRNKILSIHRQNIKSPMIEILGGIIFGDDAVNPDENTKSSFLKSGIFHILAASGMNVTLIFGIWFFFAKTLRFNYKFSILSGITLISVYTCMTGFGPPIIRAFLMLTLILIGKLIDRQTSTIALLFIVGLLMLFYNPLMTFDIGFQLSFIVTFALILTAPLLNFNFKNKYINMTLGACMIPIIAQIYAMPLQLYYFNTVTIYSVLTNIAIIPVLSIVSFLGFMSSFLALIPYVATKVCFISDFILNPLLIYIVKVAEIFSSLPNAIIYLKKPSLLQIILYFTIVILITCCFVYKLNKKKIFITLSILMLLFLGTFIPPIKTSTEVIYFSVGNADSILIKSDKNKYFLIDTGKQAYLSGTSQAKKVVIKYLNDKGIKTLDGLILSHFDSDHAGGAIDILKEIKVKRVFISDSYENTQLSSEITNYLKENQINTIIVKDETEIYNDKNFDLKSIKIDKKDFDENQKSIITLLTAHKKNFLFMGDGDVKTFNLLPKEYRENIECIKSGHHGAKGTINKEIVKAGKFFIISTGPNIYNHPSNETLNTIMAANKSYYRTDDYNALKIEINKNGEVRYFAYSPKMLTFRDIKH